MDFFELLNYSGLFLMGVDDPFTALWISLVIAGVLFAVLYALQSVALYTIAKREGYKNRWMAFIPFFNSYYIGVVSDKNRFYNIPGKALSLALAIVELVLVAGFVLSTVVDCFVFYSGLYDPVTQQVSVMGQTQTVTVGYASSARIAGTWLGWIFDYLGNILTWVNYVYIILCVLVVISFFQTYACRTYVWMSLGCALFPIKGLLMFIVRNNRGMNYREYIRGEQRRRYQMYQQYSSNAGANGGYNPYNGRPSAPPRDDPYADPPSEGQSGDPFDGFGSSSGSSSSSPDDPFDEFKN